MGYDQTGVLSFFLRSNVAAEYNPPTMYLMLSVGFLFHLRACYKIFKKHKKIRANFVTIEQEQKDLQKDVQDLVLSETLEVLTPIAHSIAVIIAYVGPNAMVLGNIRNSYWTYEAMTALEPFLNEEFQMVVIDLGAGVISALFLWKFCKINIIQQCCNILKVYWAMISIHLAVNLAVVSIID